MVESQRGHNKEHLIPLLISSLLTGNALLMIFQIRTLCLGIVCRPQTFFQTVFIISSLEGP
ncbi:hypothetical protein MtrunA17_Chr5g0437151 [Medicago truncatula]|uniref:Transmembrane protein n=1 Tax=Medicago truncatula TaxID=3880 RepID=A0A396HXA3_MEDTR|nr:hypothetical protein MtrunA17_Chr5g0437151 [Medicago truncatula]